MVEVLVAEARSRARESHEALLTVACERDASIDAASVHLKEIERMRAAVEVGECEWQRVEMARTELSVRLEEEWRHHGPRGKRTESPLSIGD